eukprot:2344453-Amphidinium_carterae.1
MTVAGRARVMLQSSPQGNGLEAWRLLSKRYERRDAQSATGLLQHILSFSFGDSLQHTKDKLAELDVLIVRYNSQAVASLPDDVEQAVLMRATPEPLRTHLMINSGQMTNALMVRRAIDDYLNARLGWQTASTPLPPSSSTDMEIDWVSKGKTKGKEKGKDGKGGKGKGKGKD